MMHFLAMIASVQTPAQLRAQATDQSAALATVSIPDADFSDDAVTAAARHFCGTTEACAQTFRQARDGLVHDYALDKGRRSTILKLIAEERDGQFINWHTSFERYDAKYSINHDPLAVLNGFSTITTHCTTHQHGNRITSTCVTHDF